jgi:hypothetical protein
MRLVIQCSVCGTILPVGSGICGTCRATGLQNLRLLFECMKCFRTGLNPTCESCSPHGISPEDARPEFTPVRAAAGWEESKPEEKPSKAGVTAEPLVESKFEIVTDSEKSIPDDSSDYELSLDDLPAADIDEEDLRLDDGDDSMVESK